MNVLKTATVTLTAATAFLTVVTPLFAVEAPEFTSCLTPTGNVIANYANGEHGIVDEGSRIGEDVVYSLPGGNAMQCFCGTNGSGVQTNWKQVGEMSSNEIKIYESEGWILVPDGSAWGLSQGAYLAKNINYSCGGGSSTTNSGGGDGKSDGRTDGRSDGLGSIVQSATGTNLASTGNILFIAEIFGAGVLMTLAGLYMRRKSN